MAITAGETEESAKTYEAGTAMSAKTRAEFFTQFEQPSAAPIDV